ncbi:MAG: NADAR family protein [Pirellulales bacterium]
MGAARLVLTAVALAGVSGAIAVGKEDVAWDAQYPAVWFEEVSKKDAPRWEILPQEAGEGEVILSKRNELGILSNFAPTPFEFRGKKYASLEGFWQAMKYPEGPDDERATAEGVTWPHTREEVTQMTAWDAKRAGDVGDAILKKLGIDWVTFEGEKFEYRPQEPGKHYELIVAATKEKVRQNPEVERVLRSTGDLKLRADHYQGRNPPAAWKYYDILMEIRSDLQTKGTD